MGPRQPGVSRSDAWGPRLCFVGPQLPTRSPLCPSRAKSGVSWDRLPGSSTPAALTLVPRQAGVWRGAESSGSRIRPGSVARLCHFGPAQPAPHL